MNQRLFTVKRGSIESTLSNFSLSSIHKQCESEALEQNIRCAWTKEEEDLLLRLKNTIKLKSWVEVASHIPGKNPKQCSYRYRKLTYSLEKSNWVKEDDLKLLELVDYFGERFDIIKTYFENKTENDTRTRYFKKINTKCAEFTPEEDSTILNLYYSIYVSEDTHKVILSKGLISIRRRLETLLKMRGEDMNKNFDIISIISNNPYLSAFKEVPTQILNRSALFDSRTDDVNSNDQSSVASKSNLISTFQEGCDDDIEDLIFCQSKKENFEANDLFGSNYEMGIYNELSSESHCVGAQKITQELSKLKVEPDSHKMVHNEANLKDTSLDSFENVFMHAFTPDSLYDSESISENYITGSDDEFSHLMRGSKVESLIEKHQKLEEVLSKLNQLSEMFYHSINDKLISSIMKDKDKKTLMDLYNNTILQEKKLIVELKSIRISVSTDSSNITLEAYANDLINKIGLLKSLIRITKMKLQLATKVYST